MRYEVGRETAALAKVMTPLRALAQKRLDNRRRRARMKVEHPERYREEQLRHSRRREKRRGRRDRLVYFREWRREYRKNPAVRLAKNLRDRLLSVLRGKVRSGESVRQLGCSAAEAVVHLERQFRPRMTWKNWGRVWHVDHIRPLASFDLTEPEQLRQACHFTNLRPLYRVENLAKGAKATYLI
jgi:hypothetical protein